MEELLKLTSEQEKVLREFFDTVLKLRNAGVLPIENRYEEEIFFINGNNIEEQWIGEDFDECPFDSELNPIAPCDIDNPKLQFDALFANYCLPDDFLCVKLKK